MQQPRINYKRLALNMALITGGIIAIAVIAKELNVKKFLRGFGNLDNLKDDRKGNTLGQEQTTEKDYSQQATQIYDLLNGLDWGIQDEETEIIDLLSKMDCETRQGMRRDFERMYGGGETLDQWFAGDMNSGNLEVARILMNCNSNFSGELDEDGFEIGAEPSQPIIVSATNTGASPMPITIG